jgi:GntR family transcriptional regulator
VQPLKDNRLSLSRQAQQYLLDRIESGAFRPGEQLPSEAHLAAQLGISRGTLREALLNLEQRGVIVRRHGVGTFISGYGQRLEGGLERLESVLELAICQGIHLHCQGLQVLQEPASLELADKLQVAPDTPLTHIQRVIVADNAPVAYMLDVVSVSILAPEDVDESFNGSVLDLLKQKWAQRIDRALAHIIALNADASLAGKLQVEPGQAILLLEETLFDEQGGTVEFSRNYFVPDFCDFYVLRR